jgi:hypothetical protein
LVRLTDYAPQPLKKRISEGRIRRLMRITNAIADLRQQIHYTSGDNKTKLTLLIIAASITVAFASSIRFDAVVTEVGYPNPQNIRAGDVIAAHVTYNPHDQINALVLINGREVFKDRSAGLVITRPNCSEAHDIYYHLEGPVYVLVFDYAADCPIVAPLDEFLLNQFFVQLYDRTPVYGKLTALP